MLDLALFSNQNPSTNIKKSLKINNLFEIIEDNKKKINNSQNNMNQS